MDGWMDRREEVRGVVSISIDRLCLHQHRHQIREHHHHLHRHYHQYHHINKHILSLIFRQQHLYHTYHDLLFLCLGLYQIHWPTPLANEGYWDGLAQCYERGMYSCC